MIYHIATRDEWDEQACEAEYAPLTFEQEGFIHCCDLHQLESVANRYFPGRDDLIILHLVPAKLEPETRYEKSGEERFPHVYGPINREAIKNTMEAQCNSDGTFDGIFDGL